MRVPTHSETISETPSDTPSDTPSEPRAERREAPRERAVPALRTRPAVATTVQGISQRMSARKAMFRASTAHSGRRSGERRPPFAAQKARSNAFRNGFGTAFRAASGAARSAAGTRGPGAARTARRGHNCARRFATHVSAEDGAVRSNRSLWPSFSPNDGASFAALNARPAHSGTISANAGLPVPGSERAPRELPAAQTAPTTQDSQMQLPESDAIRAGAHSACCRMSCRPWNVPGGTNRTQGARSEGNCGRGWHRGG